MRAQWVCRHCGSWPANIFQRTCWLALPSAARSAGSSRPSIHYAPKPQRVADSLKRPRRGACAGGAGALGDTALLEPEGHSGADRDEDEAGRASAGAHARETRFPEDPRAARGGEHAYASAERDFRLRRGAEARDVNAHVVEAAECSSELGSQNLDRDLAMMFLVMGEIDGRHPPSAELPLNLVPVAQGGFQASEHGQRVLQVASDLS